MYNRFSQTASDITPSIRDYNGVLANRLLKTKAVISDFDAKTPVFACFSQKFVEVGLRALRFPGRCRFGGPFGAFFFGLPGGGL